jgi:hypothetical protein
MIKDDNDDQYSKKLGKAHIQERVDIKAIKRKRAEKVQSIQQECGVVPRDKARASIEELIEMIGIVLNTGKGTTVIKEYAGTHDKDDHWRKDIAKPIAGKSFKLALESYSNHPVMAAIEQNPTYCKRTLLKQTVTGALRMLGKYVMAYHASKAQEEDNRQLKEMLAIKDSLVGKSPDWGLGQELRNQGKTIRVIADILGVGRTTVSNNTNPRQK